MDKYLKRSSNDESGTAPKQRVPKVTEVEKNKSATSAALKTVKKNG